MEDSKSKKKVTNIAELLDDQLAVYNDLRNGDIGLSEAKTAINAAGKIFSNIKTRAEYNKMLGSKKRISFMEVPDERNT